MSKIRYNNQSAHIAIYEMVLQEKITEVCRKICFDDSQISWVIFDAESFYSSKIASSVLVGTRGRDYGFLSQIRMRFGFQQRQYKWHNPKAQVC